jgi:hypothetical protein
MITEIETEALALLDRIPEPVLFLLFSAVALGFLLGVVGLAYRLAGPILLAIIVYWILSSAG